MAETNIWGFPLLFYFFFLHRAKDVLWPPGELLYVSPKNGGFYPPTPKTLTK